MRSRLDDLIDSLVAAELAKRARGVPRRSWITRHKIIGGGTVAILSIAVLAVAFSTSPTDAHCTTFSSPNSGSPQNRMAVVDTLSTDLPDPAFVHTVRMLASRAGFALDYYEANSTTLELFLNLPRMNYALVVFRTHSATAALTTSEPYSQQSHMIDQLLDKVGSVKVNQTVYFGMTPSSVTSLMCGRFPGTILMAMGCSTMSRTDLADAFVRMGARAFIGWDSLATTSHSDLTFGLVIQVLLEHGTVASAVEAAMHQIGPDPVFGGELRYYPATQGQSTIQM